MQASALDSLTGSEICTALLIWVVALPADVFLETLTVQLRQDTYRKIACPSELPLYSQGSAARFDQCPPQLANIKLCSLPPFSNTSNQTLLGLGLAWLTGLCPGTPKHCQNGHHHSPDSPRDSPRGIGSGKPGTLKPNLTVDVTAPPRKDPLASPFQEKVNCPRVAGQLNTKGECPQELQ